MSNPPVGAQMRLRLFPIRAIQALEAALIAAALGLFKLLPRRAAASFGAALARALGPLLPMTRVARRNLALCFPEKTEAERARIIRAMWDNLGRIAGEFTHRRALWDASLKTVADRYGADRLRQDAARGERATLTAERIEIVGAEQLRMLLDRT